jgi:hypothetical protein
MIGKLEIVGLYEFNDEYQVIDEDRTVWFQGSKLNCITYIEKTNKYEK